MYTIVVFDDNKIDQRCKVEISCQCIFSSIFLPDEKCLQFTAKISDTLYKLTKPVHTARVLLLVQVISMDL